MRSFFALSLVVLAASVTGCSDNSQLDPCDPQVFQCDLPAAPHCDGDTLVTTDPGVCAVVDGNPACSFPEQRTDCTASDQVCANGACHAPDDPCAMTTCDAPPVAACQGDTAVTYDAAGTCDGSSGSAVCSYAEHDTDCTATSQVCDAGACVDPCDGVTCDTPPMDDCTGDTRNQYPATGTCDGSSGSPVCVYTPTTTDCTTTDQACSAGACVDPCDAITCVSPPGNDCTAGVWTSYPASGICSSPGGVPQCDYAPTTTDCGAQNLACDTTNGCYDACGSVTCDAPPGNDCTGDVFTTYAATGTCDSTTGVCTYAPTTDDCGAQNLACDTTNGCYDACAAVTCDAPPGNDCTGDVFTTYAATGTCDSTTGTCSYAATPTDCAAADQACDTSLGCYDPCPSFTCDTPPPAECNGGILSVYDASGTCSSPGGVPECAYGTTDTDCAAADLACDAGSAMCIDPCIGFTCDTPPVDFCTGDTLSTYGATGTCSAPGGIVQCDYTTTDTDCTTTPGDECIAGACRTPVSIDFCRLQSPTTIDDVATSIHTVYGHVYVAGVTDQTTGTDVDPRIVGSVGFGDTGTTPDTWTAWTDAAANLAYGPASPGYEMNNDEYQADAPLPATPGQSQDVAYRFSGDGGRTWTYCDGDNGGSSDGFTNPGVATIVGAFFSEYVEGSSNNKAVEIYNPGPGAFNLAGCTVEVYFNGSASATQHIKLDTTATTEIAPGDVFVMCNSSYALGDAAECDVTSGGASWNGDDAVQLLCNGASYDVIGQIGVDPGSEWGTGDVSTQDNTILRVCTQTTGDPDGSDAFDPSVEWAGYPQNETFLGDRSCPLPTP
jgi:Lamin Tail Domain